jgi:hypothetical protein
MRLANARARLNGGHSGGVAQLGERLNGIQEVRGSIPLASMAGFSRLNASFLYAAVDEEEFSMDPGGYGRFSPTASATRPFFVSDAGIAQLVEHNLAKVGVAGSSPVSRSFH